MAESIMDAWAALRARLEGRKRELSEAVRAYPTPIARCDDQLPKAIAQRDAAARLARAALEIDASRAALRDAEWHERVRDFAAQLASAEDDGACDAARVLAALGAP